MIRVANIVGARPQFIKAGPVSKALKFQQIDELLINTGQHYDPLMSQRIMQDIGLRQPDINLGVGSGPHAVQTGRMMERLEAVLVENPVDLVVVYGDTNTTLAAAIAATKLDIPTAHVEAGLRSFNRKMPEELNRVLTDHACDFLYAPTQTAMGHLEREGLLDRATLTGDVMVDALESIDFISVPRPEWADGEFYLATIHRAENTDDGDRLSGILDGLATTGIPVHLLAHPRLRRQIEQFGMEPGGSLTLHDPLSYSEMLATLQTSRGLYTDSGGLQKEAYILGVPCVTIRDETEWPETLAGSRNVLVTPGPNLGAMMPTLDAGLGQKVFGDGTAARRIVECILMEVT
ncbi:MAG TPA: UDP-N-acetylglucosamine 2-epimerase (non-hydrolyzing) [Acidimicrobiia bacterium]|nr:UDP-N-acetylglucosamine 2-epimerase (non-hydrolyzing) [Acidimicrobiia bacterium]